ncbi:hypothetical protein [Pleomorphomonas sp. T1.2MG-36]|uniref:hypothetical protein n=1 Tax=Pleomorphomonas sp. T1.2MG-36 TaxID=3041167 RepID=UPI0025417795|nr:hypothetical protein [Pleomorphomonas sp. T1.2MG-36]
MMDVHQRVDPVPQEANSLEQDIRVATQRGHLTFFKLFGWTKTDFQPLPCIQPAAHCSFAPSKKNNVLMGQSVCFSPPIHGSQNPLPHAISWMDNIAFKKCFSLQAIRHAFL